MWNLEAVTQRRAEGKTLPQEVFGVSLGRNADTRVYEDGKTTEGEVQEGVRFVVPWL